MIEADLRTYLLGDATVLAGVQDRCFPLAIPQGSKFPAITYQLIGAPRPDRPTTGPPSVVAARMQYDVWTHRGEGLAPYAAGKALADAVRQRLDGYAGSLGSGLASVQHIRLENERDTGFDDSGELYRITLDFTVWYGETSP